MRPQDRARPERGSVSLAPAGFGLGRVACLMVAAAAGLGVAGGAHGQVAYQNAFLEAPSETGSGQWSAGSLATSPSGQQFLGGFSNTATSLTVDRLPEHTHVLIGMDLVLIGAWTGNSGSGKAGASVVPTRIRITTSDGNVLLDASFANEDGTFTLTQSYPDPLRQDAKYNAGQGAWSNNQLGFTDAATGSPRDSVYRVFFSFPHTSARVTVTIEADGLTEAASWGLDNVVVETFMVPLESNLALGELGRLASLGSGGGSGGSPATGGIDKPGPSLGGGGGGGDGGGGGGGGDPTPPTPVPGPGAAVIVTIGGAIALRRRRV